MVSPRQLEVLRIIRDWSSESWGDVWTHYGTVNGHRVGLEFSNFDRVADALVRKGLVDNRDGVISLTDAGAALVETFDKKEDVVMATYRPIANDRAINFLNQVMTTDHRLRLVRTVVEQGRVNDAPIAIREYVGRVAAQAGKWEWIDLLKVQDDAL